MLTRLFYRLLDLRLALEWTRNNVAAFGGDPEKITLIGQSAGAAIVDMMISAPPDPLNFRAAIMESGQASYNGGAAVPGWAYNTLAKDIGCNGTAAEKYTCMTTASAKRLKNVSEKQGIWFGPPIQDGATWAKAPRQNRLHSTNESSVMARVPVLLGSNAEEGAIYTTGVQNAVTFLQEHYGFSKAKAKALLEYYPIAAGSRIQTPQDQATAVMTESSFGCPAGFVYNDSLSVGIPSWRYYFNASFSNSELVPGAYHASEIPLVFGSYQRENATEFQASLSQDMQQAWSRFAKNPTAGPGWRQDAVAVFGGNASPGETDEGRPTMTLATTSWMDQRCALYKPST
jgi:cholinesterase